MTDNDRTDAASWALQLALLMIEIKVEGRPLDQDFELPDDPSGMLLLLSAATEIAARLVMSFDQDPVTIIAALKMHAMEATTS